MPTRPHSHRKPKRQSIAFEARLRIFSTVAALIFMGLCASVLALLHVSLGPMLATLGILLLILLLVFAAFIEEAIRPIQTLANVVASLREEDYSFRARGANRDDSVGQLSLEINALADTLQAQRVGALEAVALLRRVIAEMDAPVLAFDQETRLRLLNPAAERVFSLLPARDLGKTATDLALTDLLDEPSEAVLQLDLPRQPAPNAKRSDPSQQPARWMIRRGAFRQRGVPHTLVVLSDVSAALREEERLAWRRLIRVIGHEISNSLTPIKSIAGSLRSRILPTPPRTDPPVSSPPVPSSSLSSPNAVLTRDLQRGLSVIENRAESLNRFVQAYRQLAQLPAPILKRVPLQPLLERVVSLEIRLDVRLLSAPDVDLLADTDQIEQLLINLVRNAVESALTCVDEETDQKELSSRPERSAAEGPAFQKELSSRPERSAAEGPAFAGTTTTPEESKNTVILSEASKSVAPAPGRNKQSERESNGPAFPAGTTTTPAESENTVILSEASKSVAPASGRNKQSERESNGPAFAGTPTTPAGSESSVILSETSENVAPAFGRNKQSDRESNGPAFPAGTTTSSAERENVVILSEASKSVAPAPGRNKQSERESNGPAFSPSGEPTTKPCTPEVTIRATEDGDLACITIEDNGPGLANPENLFVPLYTTKKSGSGVGLALARQIVEAHGGVIDLRNKPNHTGCIAEVRIPIAERTRS